MAYLIGIGISVALLAGFLTLISFERSSGKRLMAGKRAQLDATATRAGFVLSHVDWGAFIRHLLGTLTERVMHDIAHTSLKVVRFLERILTRMVRTLRERRGITSEVTEDAEGLLEALMLRARSALRSARKRPPTKS